MKTIILGLLATFALAAPAVVNAQVVTYNANPTGGFQYGAGNNYTPANATVLTNGNNELAVRFHQTGVVAPASSGNGIVFFCTRHDPDQLRLEHRWRQWWRCYFQRQYLFDEFVNRPDRELQPIVRYQ